MTYLILAMLFALCGILRAYNFKLMKNNSFFYLLGAILILFTSFKYGVGYDYFSYMYIFESVPAGVTNPIYYESIKGELLFLYIFSFFKGIGMDYFQSSIFLFALINFLLLRFIKKNSINVYMSIFFLFSLYFVYIFSTLRQGLALALFLNFVFPFLSKNKHLRSLIIYSIGVFILSFIHQSILVTLFFPLIFRFNHFFKNKNRVFLTSIVIFIIVPFFLKNYISTIFILFNKKGYLEEVYSINYIALLSRYLMFIVVLYFYNPKDRLSVNLKSVYLFGFFIYLLFSFSDLTASRLQAYFKIYDIIIFPYIIIQISQIRLVKIFSVYFISFTIFISTLNGIASHSNRNFYNYPYITLANKSDIYKYNLYHE